MAPAELVIELTGDCNERKSRENDRRLLTVEKIERSFKAKGDS